MPHITTPRGIDWHYTIDGEGEDILFLHGFGVSSRIWQTQAEFFSSTYKVMTIDLPGHGQSSWKPLTLAELTIDIKFILETLHIPHVNVIASSFGGMVALGLLKVAPWHIHRMVLVGALPKFAKTEQYPAGLDIERIRKLSGQFDGDYATILDIFFRSLFSQQDRESPVFKWLKQFRREDGLPNREALKNFLNILEQEDLRDVLASINCPVLFVNGAKDYICPPAVVEWLKETVPLASFVDFKDVGHFPFLTKPKEFNALVEDFLTA